MSKFWPAEITGLFGAYCWVRPGVFAESEEVSISFKLELEASFPNGIDDVVVPEIPNTFKAKLRGRLRKIKPVTDFHHSYREHTVAIGDRVLLEIEKNSLIIVSLKERRNEFIRASFFRKQVLASNLDLVGILISILEPSLNRGFLLRVLTEAACSNIKPVVFFTKADLESQYSSIQKKIFQETEAVLSYAKILYYKFSAKKNFKAGFCKNIESHLTGKRVLLMGQSGVGKSTFLNKLIGSNLQETREVSKIAKGRHTTTNPVLIKWEQSDIIDMPGVREFGLIHRSPNEIANNFPFFSELGCRFSNCQHLNEPNCKIQNSVEKKEIPSWIYNIYCDIIDSSKETWKLRRGNILPR